MDNGRVIAISVSERKGEKKQNVNEVKLIEGLGILNDAHAEGGARQVSLLTDESIARMRQDGLDISYGDFAENIVTRGIEHKKFIPGVILMIGDEALLRVIKVGKECCMPCRIFRQVGYCIMPKEGVFCSVERSGTARVGDSVYIKRGDVD